MGHKKHKHSHHHEEHKPEKNNDLAKNIKWFLFWFVTYGLLIWLFDLIRIKYGLFEKPVVYYLILGFYLRIFSKFIFCAVKKYTFSFNRVFSWALIYALLLFVIDFLIGQFNTLTNLYAILAIKTAIFSILIMFLRRANMKLGIKMPRLLRSPSQIFTGIVLIVFGILCWRFSGLVFLDWFNWPEGMAWSWLIGLGFLIAGFLTLLAWWRNNVLQHRFGLKIGKW